MIRDKISGIYCISNIKTGKRYIGYGTNLKIRWNGHKRQLRKNIHNNPYLQSSYNKWGKENFEFSIIQEINESTETLRLMEIYWIVYFNSYYKDGCGYNMTYGGEGTYGYKHTDEQIKRNSDAKKGKPSWNKGIPMSEESKLKASQSHKNLSEETRRKQSLAKKGRPSNNKGKKASDETRRKQSLAKKGKPISKAATEGSIRALKGVPKSEEQRRKMSESQIFTKKGKNPSSKYIGVYFDKTKNKYRGRISYEGKDIAVGTFPTELEAALAYNEAAIEFYGWKAKLNDISKDEIEKLWEMQIETQ